MKCVYGEHEPRVWPHPCPSRRGEACLTDLDPDFASLLEREPQVESRAELAGLYLERAHLADAKTDRYRRELAQALLTSESQAARISSLEGVLREIRGKLTKKIQPEVELWNAVNEYTAACGGNPVRMIPDSIISLISETLDPHKPWCRDENHQGPCLSDPEERDDGE